MIGQTISHFRIIQKLGGGGIGVVYKAQDRRLDRPVALKFLPLHLAHGREEKQRFIHEAKAASALDYPNICTIYEIDETPEGQVFIAMACYEGESLKRKIDREVPSVEETVQIGTQIAKGLSKAHQQGIVHRDIKPANIMINRDGTVKIVDFGLAKLAGQTRLTRSGAALGTVAYMSPEQARGEEIGAETDIWALGVVLYEMLTGSRPFIGDRDQAVIYSILNEGPRPISVFRTGVPPELQQAVEKALQKRPDQRHHDMEAFSTSLGAVARRVPGLLTTRKDSRAQVLPSIAVLPFTNMSADPEQEYFCDGMAEEIINALVKVEGLLVAARTSAFAFKDKREDIREIVRKLNVNKVLEGDRVVSTSHCSGSCLRCGLCRPSLRPH